MTISLNIPCSALLSLKETARYLRINPRTLTRWRAQGRFPQPLKLGTTKRPRLRFRLADIETYLAQQGGAM